MTTVAVMQPYFVPYAGYFRLFKVADIVVLFDCVQFARRGWVHRNRLHNANGILDWLTLPMEKGPVDIRIDDLRFVSDAAGRLDAAFRRFPALVKPQIPDAGLVSMLRSPKSADVTSYLHESIVEICSRLGFAPQIVRSSSFDLDPNLHAADRVMELVRRVGGTRYINASGGTALYDRDTFLRSGIELSFLKPYEGSTGSMLERLLLEPREAIADEIARESILE